MFPVFLSALRFSPFPMIGIVDSVNVNVNINAWFSVIATSLLILLKVFPLSKLDLRSGTA